MDKRKKRVPPAEDNIGAFEDAIAATWGAVPPSVRTSSATGEGRAELLALVSQLRQLFMQTHTLA